MPRLDVTVQDAFGRIRPTWAGRNDDDPPGRWTFSCPFCGSGDVAPQDGRLWSGRPLNCSNPWCEAQAPRPGLREALIDAAHDAAIREDERRGAEILRRGIVAASAERHAEHEAWERATVEQAIRRGTCTHPRCLFAPGWERARFIRHRKPCPNSTR